MAKYYIIIRGPLGSGKSTVSKKLVKVLKARYINIDRILEENKLTKYKEKGYVSQKSFIQVNELIAPKAKRFLDKNIAIVFDGNFYWKSQIDDLIQKIKYPNYVFTLKVPLRICTERDSKRTKIHGASAVKAVYKKSTGFRYGVTIDATKGLSEVITNILSYLP